MKSDTHNKTVIISGANGYFGGIACQNFQKWGWQVLSATRQPGADIFLDLDHPEDFSEQKIDTPVDLFIHAAAAHEVTCRKQPYRSIVQNVAGTKAALEFCIANSIQKFVYLSTFHVFSHLNGRIDELTQPSPANDYGLSHLQAEEYVQMYTREQKIQGMVVRPSNFFGIPVDVEQCKRWTLTPLAFCKDAIEQKQIILKTPGFQKRNFVAISDICTVIHRAFPRIQEFPLLHISGPDTISIRDLAHLIQKVMSNYLNQEIDLIIPDGKCIEQNFAYTSCYLDNIYLPSLKIESFIIDFCQQLNQNPHFVF